MDIQANVKAITFLFIIFAVAFVFISMFLRFEIEDMQKQIKAMQDDINKCATTKKLAEREIILRKDIISLKSNYERLKGMMEFTDKKVDDMVLSYQTLDEILKQMGSDAQKRYMRKVGE